MARRRVVNHEGQEVLSLNGPPSIKVTYTVERAKEAALLRAKRTDELKINKRTSPFNSRVSKLWVPRSGTEHSYVVSCPETYIVKNQIAARSRTKEKYREDSGVSRAQVKVWGGFSAGNVSIKAAEDFKGYVLDSHRTFLKFVDVLPKGMDFSGVYTGEAVRGSEPALSGLRDYVIDLRSFVGANVEGDHRRRKWIQSSWVNMRAEAKEWADGYIGKLTNQGVEELFEEAYYSNSSRGLFWKGVIGRIDEQKRLRSQTPPQYEEVPIEIYERYMENPEVY